MNKYAKIALDGLITNNASFRLVLGTCASLGLSSAALNGLGMGLSVTAVLLLSNTLVSLLRKVIPDAVRIPAFILTIATTVTLLRMFLDKFLPDLHAAMGVYLPLIVVNCVILGRAESFASKNPLPDSILDGLSTGLGFTLALTVMGMIREFLGSGKLFGLQIMDFSIGFFSAQAGAFFVYGICIAVFSACTNAYDKSHRKRHSRMLRTGALPKNKAQEGGA